MKKFAVFSAIAILSACATSTVPTQNPTHVLAGLWKTGKYRAPGENTGLLVVTRDTGMRGGACIPIITIGKEQIAPIDQGSLLELHLPAGQHSLRAYPNRNCGASAIETLIEIEHEQVTHYRLGFVKRAMVFTPTAN
ncbi:Uncharacterised protein [Zhongshania aliphaticivorans]|uniref:Lipoprotein n=1 Tax=Zhongshania aliphaticivorans TaxID=1470434 RepID=A0A5S9N785_9GAMM|nr:hypothetical protein [Zhongshania aliphaticivorans]CAA0080218.1 Uncharacterised protein [Zhongshania aliphaticivorans]CAA0085779.1 Uncharacterised protein [Zhongshania aliphaticivorans]